MLCCIFNSLHYALWTCLCLMRRMISFYGKENTTEDGEKLIVNTSFIRSFYRQSWLQLNVIMFWGRIEKGLWCVFAGQLKTRVCRKITCSSETLEVFQPDLNGHTQKRGDPVLGAIFLWRWLRVESFSPPWANVINIISCCRGAGCRS